MNSTTWKQLSRIAAILAVSLLCAQSLAVAHSHDLVDDGICAVCATSSDGAILTNATDLAPPVVRPLVEPPAEIVEPRACLSFKQHSRAPPVA